MRLTALMRVLLFSTLISCAAACVEESWSASPTDPEFRRKRAYYLLVGKSLVNIVAEHRAMALRGEAPKQFGRTSWFASLNTTQSVGARTSCAVEPLSMIVTVTTTLPRVGNSSQFSPEDSSQWLAFLPALEYHEARHDSVIVSEASAFLRQVEGERNRTMAMKSISQCLTELRDRIDRATTTLDEVTQHGMTEGAVLIVPSFRKIPSAWCLVCATGS